MLRKLKDTFFRFVCLAAWLSALPATGLAADTDDLLPPEQAFPARVERQAKTLVVTLDVADGYYVYRDRIAFETRPGGQVGKPALPAGHVKNDPYFGEQTIYTGTNRITLPLTSPSSGKFVLSFKLQGCAQAGVCYPPYTHTLEVPAGKPSTAVAATEGKTPPKPVPAATPADPAPAPPAVNRQAAGWLAAEASAARAPAPAVPPAQGIDRGNIAATLLAFLAAGVGMAFTACMYPLLPIVSSLIAGQGHSLTRTRGFLLTFAYVQGLALTYTAVGVAAGLTGSLLTVWLQQPAVVLTASALMVVFALSMFDLYSIQLPSALQSRLAESSNRLSGGHLATVFAMGSLSALLVGPCVAPPLALALGYIGSTGDAVLGGAALYAMAMGLGLPLLLIGTFGGHVLPRAGGWMKHVKSAFGVVMLGVALWMASPFLPSALVLLLWGLLAIGLAVFLGAADALPANAHAARRLAKAAGIALLLAGTAQLAGALSGAKNPLRPLEALASPGQAPSPAPAFAPVGSTRELDLAIRNAAGKPVMLDFYADWCVSCKEMEDTTFRDPAVEASLRRYVLLRADVTANAPEHVALLKRFGLFGPPGIILFDKAGKEAGRVVGYTDSAPFLNTIDPLTRG
ncbi:protein-disulfide reductase DsbD [Paludibacterium paludis]|uniref:Thiol:disulfide interchange protein DsbD n=1 Tax=Paludibacterium paludis TaxID=1225769 RepID=A0A918P4X2_9NEIS|nr:protein-disulfide reductase DsbD [Paludibacterium paludis]GGY20980.1 thiol:disulfide interchange protein DsbD [Paludibacterium paludis]